MTFKTSLRRLRVKAATCCPISPLTTTTGWILRGDKGKWGGGGKGGIPRFQHNPVEVPSSIKALSKYQH